MFKLLIGLNMVATIQYASSFSSDHVNRFDAFDKSICDFVTERKAHTLIDGGCSLNSTLKEVMDFLLDYGQRYACHHFDS